MFLLSSLISQYRRPSISHNSRSYLQRHGVFHRLLIFRMGFWDGTKCTMRGVYRRFGECVT
jgi:hypothetical protein